MHQCFSPYVCLRVRGKVKTCTVKMLVTIKAASASASGWCALLLLLLPQGMPIVGSGVYLAWTSGVLVLVLRCLGPGLLVPGNNE